MRQKSPISPNLSQMRVQLTPQNGVSWGVKRVGWMLALGCVLALTGCGAVDQVKDQVTRETFAPTQPTTNGVVMHVYLDRSGSAKDLRPEISKQVMQLLDLYPNAPEVTLHWYSQECKKITTTVSSLPNLTGIMDDYVKDTNDDDKGIKGTNLSVAFRDLQTQATRAGSAQVIGVFVTDGGFEDDQSVLGKETEVLRDMPNVTTLVFIGLDADGTTKLTTLDSVVRDRFVMGTGGEAQKQFFDITLENGGPKLDQAKSAIQSQIASATPAATETAAE